MKKFLLLAYTCMASSIITKAQIPATYQARLQEVLDSTCNEYNIKGASAAVHVPGMGTWKGVYGISSVGVPITEDMLFGIGSNTKTFVSTSMLRLQEQGLISLEDTIGSWVQHPNVNGQITIRQLLNHTSGIYNFTNNPAFTDSIFSDVTRIWEGEEIMQFVLTPPFPAGTSWQYSNSNYLIAGLIIEAVTGQNLEDILQDEVYTPSGFTNTLLYPMQTNTAPIANLWSKAFTGSYMEDLITEYNYSHNAMFSGAWAAGAIMSTAEENAMFWSRLIQGQLFSNSSLLQMKETITLSSTVSYGLGIFRRKNFNGRTIYNHGGTNIGYINENLADSISGVGISVLTNQDSVGNSIILNQIVAGLHKVTINPPTSISNLELEPEVMLAPNPAHDMVTITGLKAAATVHFYDVTGREVLHQEYTSGHPLNISALAAGTYLVRFSSDQRFYPDTRKLVVQH